MVLVAVVLGVIVILLLQKILEEEEILNLLLVLQLVQFTQLPLVLEVLVLKAFVVEAELHPLLLVQT
tara:strand:- start:547 stop:747 length:201 start_codon:yes stop_codon:yes gene_type:complete